MDSSIPTREFVGFRPKCYAFLCIGKVDGNVVQHAKPTEKKTAKCVKRKVKDEHLHFSHYMDALHSFQTFVCKQNLISSTAHSVHTVHQRKVGLTAFDTKRWLCEDTVHTHSRGHRDTVADSMFLVNRSFLIRCITDAGVLSRSELPGASPRADRLQSRAESTGESDFESACSSPRAELEDESDYSWCDFG